MTAAVRLAQALHDAEAVVTCVPGFGGTQVFEAYRSLAASLEVSSQAAPAWSFHEDVAFTVAHGAALAGRRAAALLKTHGLAKAANSALDAVTAGVTAGFVVVVFDDPAGRHSDSVADPVRLLDGLQIPFVKAGPDLRADLFACFETSERTGLPRALVVDADAVDAPAVDAADGLPPPLMAGYRRDVAHHVLCPPLAPFQQRVLRAKQAGEDWRGLAPPVLPRVPDDLPGAWRPALDAYAPFFDVFRARLRGLAAGDTGLSGVFALPPFDAIDVGTCMGGSVSLALGAALAGRTPAWALLGDFAFVAAGHLGLVEAVLRGVPLRVVVFADGKASATGGQPVPAALLRRLLAGYADAVIRLDDPLDPAAVARALDAAEAAGGLRIVVADYTRAGAAG